MFVSRGTVDQLLLRRAAELTLEQGKRYFMLSNQSEIANSAGQYGSKPSTVAIVKILADNSGSGAFDAVIVIAETNAVADGKLSEPARKTLDALKQSAP